MPLQVSYKKPSGELIVVKKPIMSESSQVISSRERVFLPSHSAEAMSVAAEKRRMDALNKGS